MKACFVSTYHTKNYTRQENILNALEATKLKTVKCIENEGILRYPKVLLKFLLNKNQCDLIVVGFRGQEILPFIRLLTKKKIIFDAFFSLYQRACFDRKMFSPNSLAGKLLFLLDKKCCEWADIVLLDTNQHIDFFCKTFKLPHSKFAKVLVGANEKLFYPKKDFVVLWYGSFVPLQGTNHVLKAAKILKDKATFWIIGKKRKNTKNILFFPKMPYSTLRFFIQKADICLGGHFSGNQASKLVISAKTFEMAAVGKPIIIGKSKAVKELFEDKKNALFCKMNSAKSIANAILELKKNPALRKKISKNARKTYSAFCSTNSLKKQLEKAISRCFND